MPIGPSEGREASRALPGNEGLEASTDNRRLLAESAQLGRANQQSIVDVQGRSHMHQYASWMHTSSSSARAAGLGKEKRPSFVTNYIEAEAHALLVSKLGRAIARQWLLTGGLPVLAALPAEEQRAKDILARHTDKDWTLCDAISFAVLDARRIARAFTFDRHFQQYRRIEVLGLE